jgi:hypothetical protein
MQMKTPAGDMVIDITDIKVKGDNIEAVGQFAQWNATVIITPQELKQLIPLARKGGVIGYVLKLPFKRK